MYRKIMMFIGMAIFLGSTSSYATDGSLGVSATLLQPVTVTWVNDLAFGNLDIPAAGSTTYTVNPNAGPHTAGQSAIAALFNVRAANGYLADVTIVEAQPIQGTNLALDTLDFTLTVSTATVSGLGATDIPVYVGGSVLVANTQPGGDYTATATLRVLYQ